MSVMELPAGSHAKKPGRFARFMSKVNDLGPKVAKVAGRGLRIAAPPALQHIKDHGYTMVGLGLFDSAMFTHSTFTGLMVTGISFLLFELKVSTE